MSYAHLSQDERHQIQHLHAGGFLAGEIAAKLERVTSTIRCELQRNISDSGKCQARGAQRPSVKRRHPASALIRILPEQWAAVDARLTNDQWSPVQTGWPRAIASRHLSVTSASNNTSARTVTVVETYGGIYAVVSSVAAVIAQGHPVAAARHESGNALVAGASQSDRLWWKVASESAPGRTTPSWARGLRVW